MMSASDRASKLKCSQCYPVLVSAIRIVLHLYTVGFSPFVFTHFISHICSFRPHQLLPGLRIIFDRSLSP